MVRKKNTIRLITGNKKSSTFPIPEPPFKYHSPIDNIFQKCVIFVPQIYESLH